jgi:sec-independent protein translocase protein TatA
MSTLGFIQNIGPMEWVVILVICLLLFGKRLPEVGKSLGKGIVEFKKGLKGVDEEIEQRSNANYQQPQGYPQQQYPQQGYQGQLPQNGPQTAPPMQQMPQQQYGQPGTVSRADGQH